MFAASAAFGAGQCSDNLSYEQLSLIGSVVPAPINLYIVVHIFSASYLFPTPTPALSQLQSVTNGEGEGEMSLNVLAEAPPPWGF